MPVIFIASQIPGEVHIVDAHSAISSLADQPAIDDLAPSLAEVVDAVLTAGQ